jgi:hypothetical protein
MWYLFNRAIAQVVRLRLLTAETRVRVQGHRCGICGGQSGTGTDFSPSPSVFPRQYHPTTAPYSLMYLGDGQLDSLGGRCYTDTSLAPSQQQQLSLLIRIQGDIIYDPIHYVICSVTRLAAM